MSERRMMEVFAKHSQQILCKILSDRKGSVAVITAAAIVLLTGMTALVVDVGALYLNRFQVANAADAAALAGAQELPGKPDDALSVAVNYASLNKKSGPNDTVIPVLSQNDTSLTVTIRRNVPLFFAKIWGLTNSTVEASATAAVKTYSGGGSTGIIPFGVEKQNFAYGQTYNLKVGGGSGYHGNFGALGLGGNGASNYLKNIKNGYNGPIHIGDWISTEPGNMSGPTASGVSYRIGMDPSATFDTVEDSSPRIVMVPIIDSMEVSGRNEVQVVGFAAFFLEGSGGSGNNSFVYGKFREMVVSGNYSSSATYYGLSVVQLTK